MSDGAPATSSTTYHRRPAVCKGAACTAECDINDICDALEERGLTAHVKVVRYSSPDPMKHGVELSEAVIGRNAAIYRSRLPNARASVIAWIGFDVVTSCEMFFGPARVVSTIRSLTD